MGFNIFWKNQLPMYCHSGQTFTTAKVLWQVLHFTKIPSVKGLEGSIMKWDTSKLNSLTFNHILLDLQCLKYRSYCVLSEYFVADIQMYGFKMSSQPIHFRHVYPLFTYHTHDAICIVNTNTLLFKYYVFFLQILLQCFNNSWPQILLRKYFT